MGRLFNVVTQAFQHHPTWNITEPDGQDAGRTNGCYWRVPFALLRHCVRESSPRDRG